MNDVENNEVETIQDDVDVQSVEPDVSVVHDTQPSKRTPKEEERSERWKLKRKQVAAKRMNVFIEDLLYSPQHFETVVNLLLNSRRFMGIVTKAVSVNTLSVLEAAKAQKTMLDNNEHILIECFDLEENRDDVFQGERIILNWHGSSEAPIDEFRTTPLQKLITLFSEKPDGYTEIIPIEEEPPEDYIKLIKKMVQAIIAHHGSISKENQYLLGLSLDPVIAENQARLKEEFEKRVDAVYDHEEALKSGIEGM